MRIDVRSTFGSMFLSIIIFIAWISICTDATAITTLTITNASGSSLVLPRGYKYGSLFLIALAVNHITNPEVMSTNESTNDDIIDKEPDNQEANALIIINVILISSVNKANLLAAVAFFLFFSASSSNSSRSLQIITLNY